MSDEAELPATVLERYALDAESIERLPSGHINLSFAAKRRDGTPCVLQRVNPVFPPAIHDDIDAVTRHLERQGLVTPILLRTDDGRHHLEIGGGVWRLLSRITGETRESIADETAAAEAGRVLGRFHRATADFNAPLASSRPAVHDLARHLGDLERAIEEHPTHRAVAETRRISADILALAAKIGPMPELATRLVHGDPKISNVIFDRGRGVCLIDLDTIARMPVALELGDALRSWCNLSAEDAADARFSTARCRAALEAYRTGAGELLSRDEWQAVPAATLSIAVELAARFAADALRERYFSWDQSRFGSAGEHNLARAAAQLALAGSIERTLPKLGEIVVTLV